MLDNNQIESNKQTFKNLLLEIGQLNQSRIKGTQNLIDWLEKTDFYTAPASTQYHQSYAGGLCEHSLQVYNHLIKLTENYNITQFPKESLIIVALLHDFCKIDFYKNYVKGAYKKDDHGNTIKGPNGKPIWEEKEGYIVNPNNKLHFGHAEKSLFIITQFYQLSAIEYQAILFHMGFADAGGYKNVPEISLAFEENTLAFLLHIADMLSTYIERK